MSKTADIIYEDDFESESEEDGKRPEMRKPLPAVQTAQPPTTRTDALLASKPAEVDVMRPPTAVVGRRGGAIAPTASSASGFVRPSTALPGAASSTTWAAIDVTKLDVGKQLGGGGFAVVYAGNYLGQSCAVKMIVDPHVTPAQTAEFMNELHTMAALQHPNIVKLIGAHIIPPKQCFVMELCGMSLFSALHENTPPPVPLRLQWALDAAKAIAHCHAQRPAIIHRDIKSPNFLVSLEPRSRDRLLPPLKLSDFGLVNTKANDAGTPAYMAPELFAGKPCNKSVDVYAFGVLLWEMMSRTIPFAGWRPLDIKDAVIGGVRPELKRLPSDLPDGIESLIVSCWDASPAKRPEISTIVDTLQPIVSRVTSAAATTVTSSSSLARPPTRGIAGGIAGGAAPVGSGDALDLLASRPGTASARQRPSSASIYGRRT